MLVARAKGLAERQVIAGHILRNSLIPFVTVLGVQFGYLIGGAVIVENVFALPGIGDLVVSAIGNRDYPVIQGVVLVVATGHRADQYRWSTSSTPSSSRASGCAAGRA